MNPNFRDMLMALFEENAEFLVVGAFAPSAHGLSRATGDLDIWVRRSTENAQSVWRALKRFGAPLRNLRVEDLQTKDIVYYMGTAPERIDVLTSISGIEFDEAWPQRTFFDLEGRAVPVLGKTDLIKNKRASGRPKDLADLAWLESDQQSA